MAEDKQCTPASVVAFTGALALGTTLALLSKVLLSEIVTNSEGEPVNFHKPLFVTFCMFLGMALALPLHFVVHALTRGVRAPLPPVRGRVYALLALPTMTDMSATTCSMIALLYIKVSVQQLVRISIIVFVALYRTGLRVGAPLARHQWLGVGLNSAAILAVGSSALVDASAGDDVPLGIAMALAGCAIMAAQFVIEEKLMAGENIPPLIVIGTEGCWGVVAMLLVVFPLAARAPGADVGGCYESLADTTAMLRAPENASLRTLAVFCAWRACALALPSP